MGIKSYRDLDIWKRSMDLVERIYRLTKGFPKEELFGLTSQLRRCAVSIPSNISEGFMRQHTNEIIQFLYISLGSCGELDTQLEVAFRLSYIRDTEKREIDEEIDHLSRMIRNLIKSLRK